HDALPILLTPTPTWSLLWVLARPKSEFGHQPHVGLSRGRERSFTPTSVTRSGQRQRWLDMSSRTSDTRVAAVSRTSGHHCTSTKSPRWSDSTALVAVIVTTRKCALTITRSSRSQGAAAGKV